MNKKILKFGLSSRIHCQQHVKILITSNDNWLNKTMVLGNNNLNYKTKCYHLNPNFNEFK